MECVEEFKVGDWVCICQNLMLVKYGFGFVVLGSMGIVYCVRLDSSFFVELSYFLNLWYCEFEEVEFVIFFRVMYFDQIYYKIIYILYEKFSVNKFFLYYRLVIGFV